MRIYYYLRDGFILDNSEYSLKAKIVLSAIRMVTQFGKGKCKLGCYIAIQCIGFCEMYQDLVIGRVTTNKVKFTKVNWKKEGF